MDIGAKAIKAPRINSQDGGGWVKSGALEWTVAGDVASKSGTPPRKHGSQCDADRLWVVDPTHQLADVL
jgi:hypothetical protein